MIMSNIEGLTNGSSKIIEAKCDFCGKERYIKYKLYNKSIKIINKFSCGDKNCMILKTKETNLIKYGVDNVSKSDKIKELKKETTLRNYGVENPFQ